MGLAAAIDYLTCLDRDGLAAHEAGDSSTYGTRVLSEVPGLKLIGTANPKASVISFLLDGVHPHDVGHDP